MQRRHTAYQANERCVQCFEIARFDGVVRKRAFSGCIDSAIQGGSSLPHVPCVVTMHGRLGVMRRFTIYDLLWGCKGPDT